MPSDHYPAQSQNTPAQKEANTGNARGFSHLGDFFPAVLQILFHPSAFFKRLKRVGFPWNAISFAGFCAMLIPAVQQALAHGMPYLFEDLLPDTFPIYLLAPSLQNAIAPDTLMMYMAIVSIVAVIAIPLYTILLHTLLRLAQAGERGFGITLQVACYSMAAWLLWAVPVLGKGLAPFVWLIILTVGLKHAHRSRWSFIFPVMSLHVAALLSVFAALNPA